jgi:hypothetical protein
VLHAHAGILAAAPHGGDCALALAMTAGVVAVAVAVLAWFGPDARVSRLDGN